MEKSTWTAWGKHDAKAYAEFMSEDAVVAVAADDVTRGREKIAANISGSTCELRSFDFHEPHLRQLGPDAAIVSYTATQDASQVALVSYQESALVVLSLHKHRLAHVSACVRGGAGVGAGNAVRTKSSRLRNDNAECGA